MAQEGPTPFVSTAIRLKPLEDDKKCCAKVPNNNSVKYLLDCKVYTFDDVFSQPATASQVFEHCCELHFVESCATRLLHAQ